MLTDAAAIAFSLVALRLAARPAAGSMTFGFKRMEILSAQANGVTLLVLAAFIVYEAIHRLFFLHMSGHCWSWSWRSSERSSTSPPP